MKIDLQTIDRLLAAGKIEVRLDTTKNVWYSCDHAELTDHKDFQTCYNGLGPVVSLAMERVATLPRSLDVKDLTATPPLLMPPDPND